MQESTRDGADERARLAETNDESCLGPIAEALTLFLEAERLLAAATWERGNAKALLEAALVALPDRLPEQELRALIRELFHNYPQINRKVLAKALYGHENPQRLKGEMERPGATCPRCGVVMTFTGKRDPARYSHNPEGTCRACDEILREADRKRHAAHWEEREAHEEALRTMPYVQYLQTPEWQERRALHLHAAHYRCQVCNAGKVLLNVHHRTYERRGRETFKDLIVLCHECHALFHREGKLKGAEAPR
jgi:hypothetical protein